MMVIVFGPVSFVLTTDGVAAYALEATAKNPTAITIAPTVL